MKRNEFTALLKKEVLNQAVENGQSWVWLNGKIGADFYDTYLRFKRESQVNPNVAKQFVKLDSALNNVYRFSDEDKTTSCLVFIHDVVRLMNVLSPNNAGVEYEYNIAKTNRINQAKILVEKFVTLAQDKKVNEFKLDLYCNEDNNLDFEKKELSLRLSETEFTKLVNHYSTQLRKVRLASLTNEQKKAKLLNSTKRGLKRCYSSTNSRLTGVSSKVIL